MKRTVHAIESLLDDLLAPLDVADAHNLCERYRAHLSLRYMEKAVVYTERFMREGGDIFREHVLEICGIPVFEMASLRLVCKKWLEWVARATHLVLGSNCWAGSIYGIVLSAPLFPHVVSITSHQRILQQQCAQFGRIKSLCIATPGYNDERGMDDIEMAQWSSLQTLEAPHCYFSMEGLVALTSLTRLNVLGDAFGYTMQSHYALTRLTNLRHLEVRRVARDVPLVQHLTALTYLSSDQPHHFTNYTGEGELHGSPECLATLFYDDADLDDDAALEAERKALPVLQADYAVYQAGCQYATLEGGWDRGVFTGRAWIRYHVMHSKKQQDEEGEEEEDQWTGYTFDGRLVNGKRDGRGYENVDGAEKTMFHGQWRQGYRHGMGLAGHCTTVNDYKSNFVPTEVEMWQYGTLCTSISIAEMRVVHDNGGVVRKVSHLMGGATEIMEVDDDCMEEIERALDVFYSPPCDSNHKWV